MRAGRLRHRVVVERQVQTPDGQGGTSFDWRPYVTLWADVTATGGREFQTAKQTRATLTDQVEMRYRVDLTADMRIVHGDRVLSIAQPPMDPDGRRARMQIFCEEIAGERP